MICPEEYLNIYIMHIVIVALDHSLGPMLGTIYLDNSEAEEDHF